MEEFELECKFGKYDTGILIKQNLYYLYSKSKVYKNLKALKLLANKTYILYSCYILGYYCI